MVEKMERKTRIISLITIGLLIVTFFSNSIPIKFLTFDVEAGDISSAWYNSTTLNVTILHFEPVINWYDFQYNDSGTWVSKLNQQIDVDNTSEYRLIVNISSDQGWDDIDYINITAWHDKGSENTIYNETLGGNINMKMQYINTTGTPSFVFNWPNFEVTFIEWNENTVQNPYGLAGITETKNLTFTFIPGYQFRYAHGPIGGWNTSKETYLFGSSWTNLNNIWSWNFNISVTDSGENNSNNVLTSWATDEFGVYSYTEIVSAGWPYLVGDPGQNVSVNDVGCSGNISLKTRSNGNYSLSVNVSDLIHVNDPTETIRIENDTIWVRVGNRTVFNNFSQTYGESIHLYGINGPNDYELAEPNGTRKLATDDGNPEKQSYDALGVEYKCNIPLGQQSGQYKGVIYYHLETQL